MKFVKEMFVILVCKLGDKEINCYDGAYSRETLKKWSKKGILKCPCCGEQYTYNHGRVRTPYFKHLNSDCVLYGEPETPEHIQGKLDLFNWIQKQNCVSEVRLEGWIPETKQRPDIMFKYNDKQYVIEYQCSPIASEYIERHELYRAVGICDIWICGTEKYIGENKRLNTLEMSSQIYYDANNKLFYTTDDLPESIFKCFVNGISVNNRNLNLMTDIHDYHDGLKNYMLIKNISNSYKCVGNQYASIYSRASNKHQHTIKDYKYVKNYSFARCYKVDDFKFANIIRFIG